MSYTTSNTANDLLNAFQQLETDQQLALFWMIYTEMGESITPAAPGGSTASPAIAEGLFEQVKALSHEEQLQLQRDLINCQDTELTREYGSLSNTTKLLFWYLLAQGMENNTIIPMPADYKLSTEAEDVFEQVKQLSFDYQISFFRDYVAPMGVDVTVVAND